MTDRTARLRVRYAETDRMGVVYYANYFVWFEVGRTEWLRQTGESYRDMERSHGITLPVIEAHCEYRQPARYDDELEIRTRASLLSAVRIRFDYEVVLATPRPSAGRPGDVLTAGYTIHAAIDQSGKPRRLPATVRGLLG
jgi:acyl-CoA thioester hydrolase